MKKKSATAKKQPLKGRFIYVVDDEPAALGLIREVLEQAGAVTVGATDPRAMLHLFAHNRPDAALIDVMMPYLDGWQLFDVMRRTALNRRTPVVFLTSTVSEAEEPRFNSAEGSCRVLAKPVNAKKLSGVLEEILAAEEET